jgi:uncharacterized membrane protein
MDQGKLMSILAYVGPLIIVSYLVAKDTASVKFHIKQGGVLFVIEIAVWVLSVMLPYLFVIWQIVNLATLVFAILGIINVVQGKEKELPLIGSFGKYIPV